MGVREGFIDSGGVALHYLDWGGDRPPLVLIHATGFLAALWRPVAERLASRFRVVALDQRGHGDSGKPDGGYAFETFANDLHALIEALQLKRPVVAGHSSGGTTIVAHAAQRRGVISRAVLIEPILPLPDWYSAQPPGGRPPNSLAGGARKRRAVWPNADALFEAYRTRDTFRTWDESLLRIYVDEGTRARDDGQIELKCPPDLEARFFEAVTKYDPWPSIAELGCPTLVLWGAESHLHGRGLSERLAEALPSSRTALVPGTAHFLPQERPDEVARLMLEFLAD